MTGEAAHDAAVDAGAITDNHDLPNDVYIVDEEDRAFGHSLDPSALALVIDGNEPWTEMAMYDGTYTGTPVHGVAPGSPIAMDVTISSG